MVETRAPRSSRRSPFPVLVLLLPLVLLVVIGLAGWAMFVGPASPTAGERAVPSVAPSRSVTPTPQPSYTDNGSMNSSALADEYRKAAAKIGAELPPGFSFPNDLPAPADPDLISPAGSGEYEALTFWRCAWTAQFLIDFDARDDKAIKRDLDTLDTWPDWDAVKADDPDGSQGAQWRDEIVQPAREGHIGLLRRLGRGGCSEMPTPDPVSEVTPTA